MQRLIIGGIILLIVMGGLLALNQSLSITDKEQTTRTKAETEVTTDKPAGMVAQ